MYYTKVYEGKPLQPIHKKLEGKIVKLSYKNAIMALVMIFFQSHGQQPKVVSKYHIMKADL